VGNDGPIWLLTAPLFLLYSALLVMVVFACYRLLAGMLTRASGLDRLVANFPAPYQPQGLVRARQTIKIGPVRWRNVVTVVLSSEGFYLSPKPIFSNHKPVLIPWREIRGWRETRLYWQRAITMSVGEPQIAEITVLQDLYGPMQPYLLR
jgi:hypothetical protein